MDKNSNFLRYYQQKEEHTGRSSSLARPTAPVELIAKIKRKKQELQEMCKKQQRPHLTTNTKYNSQLDDLRRTDCILRGGGNTNSSVFIQKRPSEMLLTDGTSDTEIIHGPRAQTNQNESMNYISQSIMKSALKSKDSTYLESKVEKYKNKLLGCELSPHDLAVYKRRLSRQNITEDDKCRSVVQYAKKKPVQTMNKTIWEEDYSIQTPISPIQKNENVSDFGKVLTKDVNENRIDASQIRTIIREEIARALEPAIKRIEACVARLEKRQGGGRNALAEWTRGKIANTFDSNEDQLY